MKWLARTAGLQVVDTVRQRRRSPIRATWSGQNQTWSRAPGSGATLVLFDRDLTPGQLRGSPTSSARIVDRTQLILDIFAQNAHKEAAAAELGSRNTACRGSGQTRA
jgi:GTP-binding protein HflX